MIGIIMESNETNKRDVELLCYFYFFIFFFFLTYYEDLFAKVKF